MKKRTTILALLSIAAGLTLGACSPKQDSKPATPGSTGGDTSVPASESGNTDVVPTRIRITQPGTVLVGDVLKVSEIVTFTPEGANQYTVTSKNTEIATVTDNETITIVGPGATSIDITCPKPDGTEKKLGSINIKALSEEGKALQDFADSVTNRYKVTGTWDWYDDKKWEEVTAEDTLTVGDKMALVVNPNYVVDWIYGKYSAVALEKDEGNAYGYTLFDAEDNELPGNSMTDAAEELAKAASVEIGERVSSQYIDEYFVISGLLDVTDFEEVTLDNGDVHFRVTDPEKTVSLIGSLLGMSVSSFTGHSAEVWLEEGALFGEIRFDDPEDADLVSFKVVTGEAADIAVLETAVTDAEPPAPTDISALVSHLDAYKTNFALDFQVGVFTPSLQPLASTIATKYKTGTALINDDLMVYSSYGYVLDEESQQYVPGEISYDGFKVDKTTGSVYGVSTDEDGLLVAGDTAIVTNEEFKDPAAVRAATAFNVAGLTESVLSAASLALAAENVYSYTPSFDSFALGALIEEISPIGYSFAEDEDVLRYAPMGLIFDYTETRGFIRLALLLNYDGTNKIGYVIDLYAPGQVEVALGDKAAVAFGYEAAPVDPGEGGGE